MRHRFLASMVVLAVVITVVLLATVPVAGQAPTAAVKKAKASALPRTPWGDPDLQGIWNNNTSTPLERPGEFAGKDLLADDELAEFTVRQQASRENRDSREGAGTDVDVARAYNAHWFPVPGKAIKRTSLILDPADGRIPALTPEWKKRADAVLAARQRPPAGPEDRNLGERCITFGVPRSPGGYNNHFLIVQSPGYVAIVIEMIHEARIIPLDGRPHIPQTMRQWLGDSRGHWEGNTLVVDTTNFTDRTSFRGSGEGLHLVERFKRVDADTIDYEFTVDDATTWAKPWTVAYPLTTLQSDVGGADGIQVPLMFEYACHEGNYGLAGQLSGARAQEKAAAEAAKKGSK